MKSVLRPGQEQGPRLARLRYLITEPRKGELLSQQSGRSSGNGNSTTFTTVKLTLWILQSPTHLLLLVGLSLSEWCYNHSQKHLHIHGTTCLMLGGLLNNPCYKQSQAPPWMMVFHVYTGCWTNQKPQKNHYTKFKTYWYFTVLLLGNECSMMPATKFKEEFWQVSMLWCGMFQVETEFWHEILSLTLSN